jgi:hypothetical protein
MLTNINLDGRLLNNLIRANDSQRLVCGYKQWDFIDDQIAVVLFDTFGEFNYIMGENINVF